jgi:phage terminase large subunit GpA-like protein
MHNLSNGRLHPMSDSGIKHSKQYIEYMKSPEWKERCKRLRRLCGFKCGRCGAMNILLEVHHKTYERLGHERNSDLEVLCARCHKRADQEREKLVNARVYQRRVDAWANKVYGDTWRDIYTFDSVSAAFDAWLTGRN